MDFQDLIDITIDAISNYSQDNFSAKWMVNIQHTIYVAIIQNDKNILNYFNPYQIRAMKELLGRGYWIHYDNDINYPVVKSLDYIFKDKIPIKNGAD